MAVLVMIYGQSGTGKSTSLRNFSRDDVAIVNVSGKPLPFRNNLKTYKRRVADAKLLGRIFWFLPECISFIMDDDGYSGRENYADWLNNRKVVK